MTQAIWLVFMRSLSLEICTFMGLFCPKHIKFQVKKHRGVMPHDTEKWCKEKLILDKYVFFLGCNRLEAVSGRYSKSAGKVFDNCLWLSSFYS